MGYSTRSTATDTALVTGDVTSDIILDGAIVNADVAAAAAIDATKLADGTVTNTELQYINSLSSNAQTQLTAKAPIADPTFTGEIGIGSANVSETELAILEGATLSTAELNYVDGVTSGVQTQLDTKLPIDPRSSTEASSATPTIDTDAVENHSITALATAVTSMSSGLSGTPVNFQKLTIRFLDDGTGRAITWGASYAAMGVALPTTTTASKVLTVGFIYDSVDSKWGCVASVEEA